MNLTAEIQKLEKLKNKGKISPAEFAAQKSALVSKAMGGSSHSAPAHTFAHTFTPASSSSHAPPPVPHATPEVHTQRQHTFPKETPSALVTIEARKKLAYIHFAAALGAINLFFGIVAVMIAWKTQGKNNPAAEEHGKVVINWLITYVIFSSLLSLGLKISDIRNLGWIIIAIGIVMPVIGGMRTLLTGKVKKYPLAISFIKRVVR